MCLLCLRVLPTLEYPEHFTLAIGHESHCTAFFVTIVWIQCDHLMQFYVPIATVQKSDRVKGRKYSLNHSFGCLFVEPEHAKNVRLFAVNTALNPIRIGQFFRVFFVEG